MYWAAISHTLNLAFILQNAQAQAKQKKWTKGLLSSHRRDKNNQAELKVVIIYKGEHILTLIPAGERQPNL